MYKSHTYTGGSMRKALMGILVLAIALPCLASVEVKSVQSRDAGKEANNVNIGLSGDAAYQVQSSHDGKVHKIIVRDAQNAVARPDYQRLSPVIDRIRTYREGSNTVVEINTMQPSRISHSQSSDRISLRLDQGQEIPPEPEDSTPLAPQTPDLSVDRDPELPTKAAARVNPTKLPAPTQASTPEPEKPIFPATIDLDSAPPPAEEREESAQAQPAEHPIKEFLRIHWSWMLLLATGLAMLIFSIRACLRSKARRYSAASTPEETPALIMDSATRQRMVMRLAEQGWTASQVAAELKLPVREVERIISKSKQRPEL